MTSRSVLIFIAFFLTVVFLSCHKDNSVEPLPISGPPALSGTVTDSTGAALDSVAVHFMTHFDKSIAKTGLAKTAVTMTIEFSVESTATVTLVFYRYGTNEVIDTLVDEEMDAGVYTVDVDNATLTNGLYYYKLYLDGRLSMRRNVMLWINDLASFADLDPITYTDRNGKFTMPVSVFGIGERLLVTSTTPDVVDTITITNTIDLVLYKDGYQTFSKQISVDTTAGNSGKFVMVR
jgi:hypothetical protein